MFSDPSVGRDVATLKPVPFCQAATAGT